MSDSIIQPMSEAFAAKGLRQVSNIEMFDGSMQSGRFLIPSQLCGLTPTRQLYKYNFTHVYYVSDLHLETWFDEYRKNVEAPERILSMSEWMKSVIDKLFSGDFLQDIILQECNNVTVLFLGDIADTFEVSALFYKEFMQRWDKIDEDNRQQFERREAERKAALAAEHEVALRIVEEYKASHSWARRAKCSLASYKRTPDEVKAAVENVERWEWHGMGYTRDFYPAQRSIYAVLGNHEIDGFIREVGPAVNDIGLDAAYEQGKQKYKDLLQSLGVHFLDFGDVAIEHDGFGRLQEKNLLIAGFCGFGCPHVIGNYEAKFKDKLALWYKKCVEDAESEGLPLVFCTHFPLLHGAIDSVSKNNVYHFCGHTHRDKLEVLSETGAIIADNQIGYGWNSHKTFVFKRIGLYPFYNPFDSYEDGCHVIKVDDYERFYVYSGDILNGTKGIKNYLEGIGGFGKPFGDTGTLYMIKRCGYYGFFIAFSKIERVYICNGGRVNRVPNVKSIDEVLSQFDAVINAYLLIFSGFRRYQEQIASYVRSFGGSGNIHGLIVDIDFYNHVSVDPTSGDTTFYYSPSFGSVKSYSDMGALLENHAPELYPVYKQLFGAGLVPYRSQNVAIKGELVEVERGGNSFYGASRYMAPIQRLFSCNILRVWDENVLNKAKVITDGLPGEGIEKRVPL